MRCKAFESLGILQIEQLHVSVRQCAPPSDSLFYFLLLLTVSCLGLPQSFDVRMPSFLSHYWILVLWWVYDVIVGVMLKIFFSPIRVILWKYLFYN